MASSQNASARFVLFKVHVITAHDSHFAGGKHAFLSMASTLAREGFDVHIVSIASRSKVSGTKPSLESYSALHGCVMPPRY